MRILRVLGKLLCAVVIGACWSVLYPYYASPMVDAIAGVLAVAAACVLFLAPATARRATIALSVISASSLAIVSIAERLWGPFPSFLLHRVFSTDGEASYNAADSEIFLALVVLSSSVYAGMVLFRHRRVDQPA
jgi:glucan phosphoethanolaminetransferase (alkaline phosphatase superfamily)